MDFNPLPRAVSSSPYPRAPPALRLEHALCSQTLSRTSSLLLSPGSSKLFQAQLHLCLSSEQSCWTHGPPLWVPLGYRVQNCVVAYLTLYLRAWSSIRAASLPQSSFSPAPAPGTFAAGKILVTSVRSECWASLAALEDGAGPWPHSVRMSKRPRARYSSQLNFSLLLGPHPPPA